jgi:hypothetical protein
MGCSEYHPQLLSSNPSTAKKKKERKEKKAAQQEWTQIMMTATKCVREVSVESLCMAQLTSLKKDCYNWKILCFV